MFRASPISQQVKNLPARDRRCWFDPWVRKIPWRRKWQPLQYSCLKNPMDGSLADTIQWIAKKQT